MDYKHFCLASVAVVAGYTTGRLAPLEPEADAASCNDDPWTEGVYYLGTELITVNDEPCDTGMTETSPAACVGDWRLRQVDFNTPELLATDESTEIRMGLEEVSP